MAKVKTKKTKRQRRYEWFILGGEDAQLNNAMSFYLEGTFGYSDTIELKCEDGVERKFWRCRDKRMAQTIWNNRDALHIKHLRIYCREFYIPRGDFGPLRDVTSPLFNNKRIKKPR